MNSRIITATKSHNYSLTQWETLILKTLQIKTTIRKIGESIANSPPSSLVHKIRVRPSATLHVCLKNYTFNSPCACVWFSSICSKTFLISCVKFHLKSFAISSKSYSTGNVTDKKKCGSRHLPLMHTANKHWHWAENKAHSSCHHLSIDLGPLPSLRRPFDPALIAGIVRMLHKSCPK